MQQHTGQHLLSSVFEERFAIDTLGWSLQPYPQPSYVELPRVPTPDEIQGALQTCNELIRQDCPITVDVALEGEEAQQRPEKIPADYVGGVVRHVQIHSNKIPSDRNPCCGTHVRLIPYRPPFFRVMLSELNTGTTGPVVSFTASDAHPA